MKKQCWAIRTRSGFVTDYHDPDQPIRTMLFKTRKHGQIWLEENLYWLRLKAEVVRVKVTITEF